LGTVLGLSLAGDGDVEFDAGEDRLAIERGGAEVELGRSIEDVGVELGIGGVDDVDVLHVALGIDIQGEDNFGVVGVSQFEAGVGDVEVGGVEQLGRGEPGVLGGCGGIGLGLADGGHAGSENGREK